MNPVLYLFGNQTLEIHGERGFVDAAVIAEIEAANIEASKAEPVCWRCDDTGLTEGFPCNCDSGRN